VAKLKAGRLHEYLKTLFAVLSQGDAREESFYPALAKLLRTVRKRMDTVMFVSPRNRRRLKAVILTSAFGMASSTSSATSKPSVPERISKQSLRASS